MLKRSLAFALGALLFVSLGSSLVSAQNAPAPADQASLQSAAGGEPQAASRTTGESAAVKPAKSGIALGLIAIGAALAIGLTALGTGIAQSRIGAAGAGTIAERPEAMGSIVILIAIPETMVILGFVVAVVLIFVL